MSVRAILLLLLSIVAHHVEADFEAKGKSNKGSMYDDKAEEFAGDTFVPRVDATKKLTPS